MSIVPNDSNRPLASKSGLSSGVRLHHMPVIVAGGVRTVEMSNLDTHGIVTFG